MRILGVLASWRVSISTTDVRDMHMCNFSAFCLLTGATPGGAPPYPQAPPQVGYPGAYPQAPYPQQVFFATVPVF